MSIPIHEMGLEALQMLLRCIAHPNEDRRRVPFDDVPVIRDSVYDHLHAQAAVGHEAGRPA